MENDLKSIVYVTINTVTNKMYVGVHVTDTPYRFDNFYGDGITGTSSFRFQHPKTPFQLDCKKYGLKYFKRYTIFESDYETALKFKNQIVSDDFIRREDTYNISKNEFEIEIHKYDINGEYISTYRNLEQASLKESLSKDNLLNAIIKNEILGGFKWSEVRKSRLIGSKEQKENKVLYTYDNGGRFIREFESIQIFAKFCNVDVNTVKKAIKYKSKCGGKYVSEEKVDRFEIRALKKLKNSTVYQYSLNGDFIKEYDGLKSVRIELRNKLTRLPKHILSGEPYFNFYWSNKKYDKFPIKEKVFRKIGQYDLEGNLIKVWNNYSSCAKVYSNIAGVLNGERKHTKGFVFKYID